MDCFRTRKESDQSSGIDYTARLEDRYAIHPEIPSIIIDLGIHLASRARMATASHVKVFIESLHGLLRKDPQVEYSLSLSNRRYERGSTVNTKTANKKYTRSGRVVSAEMSLWLCALAIAVTSAIWTKERGTLPGLAQIETVSNNTVPNTTDTRGTGVPPVVFENVAFENTTPEKDIGETPVPPMLEELPAHDQSTRWFDGKMIRPSRVIYMTVTGYSPDARSCGKFADNKTATMYSVWTNGMNLVAADPKLLPYWSMVSIPGYATNDIVPVLDCGGAIKGNRIDLLYPTHKLARQWGVRSLPVTVWEFVEEE